MFCRLCVFCRAAPVPFDVRPHDVLSRARSCSQTVVVLIFAIRAAYLCLLAMHLLYRFMFDFLRRVVRSHTRTPHNKLACLRVCMMQFTKMQKGSSNFLRRFFSQWRASYAYHSGRHACERGISNMPRAIGTSLDDRPPPLDVRITRLTHTVRSHAARRQRMQTVTTTQRHTKQDKKKKKRWIIPERASVCHNTSIMHLPAAKCNGVDLRPAVSLAFTVCELISFFTLTMSPVLHASNSSRNGSLAMTASKLTVSSVRLRLDIFSLLLFWPKRQSNFHLSRSKNRRQQTTLIPVSSIKFYFFVFFSFVLFLLLCLFACKKKKKLLRCCH